jgi:hypothetical protein
MFQLIELCDLFRSHLIVIGFVIEIKLVSLVIFGLIGHVVVALLEKYVTAVALK